MDSQGTVLLDKLGIKIVAKEVSYDESILGPAMVVYIENNFGKDIIKSVRRRETYVILNDWVMN